MCRLRPGLEGISENIRVRSIIGRFLEHTRIYWFANDGGKPVVIGSSADWMERNMLNRVETGFELFGKNAERIRKELDYYLQDNAQAWELHSDGSYTLVQPKEGEERFSAQQKLLDELAV
jgi:polyphosphate kinase